MTTRRARKVIALTTAVLALAGCTVNRALDIANIDDMTQSPDFSVTSARVEQTVGVTELILELAIANPSASIVLFNRVDLGHSYVLRCDGEPRRSSSSGSPVSTWTYECIGDTDWPSDTSEAYLTIHSDHQVVRLSGDWF
ncbi:hypothetical protein [Microbacterium pumilum]|uniref:Uncharacterized protein n=1 Tax=Microbacterium pumilum TaxID=344165 RepID=A0ABN2T200_9MICO